MQIWFYTNLKYMSGRSQWTAMYTNLYALNVPSNYVAVTATNSHISYMLKL